MDRITVRDAERQAARLAKELGHPFHYTCQRTGDTIAPDMAELAPYGTAGAWVLDQSAAGGWLNLREYTTEGSGPLRSAINLDAWKAATLWDACRFALDVLREARFSSESVNP